MSQQVLDRDLVIIESLNVTKIRESLFTVPAKNQFDIFFWRETIQNSNLTAFHSKLIGTLYVDKLDMLKTKTKRSQFSSAPRI